MSSSVSVPAPGSNFSSWLSLQGWEQEQLNNQQRCGTAAAAATTTDTAAAADVTHSPAPPPLLSLIRSPVEQQLLSGIVSSASELDELLQQLEWEARKARWQARTKKSRVTLTTESKGDPGGLGVLFEKISNTLSSLRTHSLPSLHSSAHLNHLLSGELDAEGCAALAASKKRVAQAEEGLTRRITALLEGKLTVDELAIRQQYEASRPTVIADPHSLNADCANSSPTRANRAAKQSDHESKEDSSDHTTSSSSSSSIPLGQPEPSMNQSSLSLHASTPPSSAASSSSSSASALVAHNSPLVLAQASQTVPQSKPTSPARHSGSLGSQQQLRSPGSSQKVSSSAAEAAFISTPPQTSGGLASLVDLQTPLHSRSVGAQSSPSSGGSKAGVLSTASKLPPPSTPVTPITAGAAAAPSSLLPQAVCGCTPSIDGVHSCKLRSPPMRTPSQMRNDVNQSTSISASKQSDNSSANASLTSQLNSTLPSQPLNCSQPGAPDIKLREDSSASLVLSFAPGNNSFGASQSQALFMGEDVEQEPLVLSLNPQMSQQLQLPSFSQANHLIRSQFARPSQAMSMLSPVLDEDVMADVDASSSSASRRSPVYDADGENEEKDPSQASEASSRAKAKSILSASAAPTVSEDKGENEPEEEHPPFAAPNLFDNDLPFPQSAPAPTTAIASGASSASATLSRSASQQLALPSRSKKSYQSPVKVSHTQVADQDESSQAAGGSGSGWKKKRKLPETTAVASSQVVSSTTSPLRTSERAKKLAKH